MSFLPKLLSDVLARKKPKAATPAEEAYGNLDAWFKEKGWPGVSIRWLENRSEGALLYPNASGGSKPSGLYADRGTVVASRHFTEEYGNEAETRLVAALYPLGPTDEQRRRAKVLLAEYNLLHETVHVEEFVTEKRADILQVKRGGDPLGQRKLVAGVMEADLGGDVTDPDTPAGAIYFLKKETYADTLGLMLFRAKNGEKEGAAVAGVISGLRKERGANDPEHETGDAIDKMMKIPVQGATYKDLSREAEKLANLQVRAKIEAVLPPDSEKSKGAVADISGDFLATMVAETQSMGCGTRSPAPDSMVEKVLMATVKRVFSGSNLGCDDPNPLAGHRQDKKSQPSIGGLTSAKSGNRL